MPQYQATAICPYCRVINRVEMYGSKRGFMKGSGALSVTCADCGKEFKSKPKELAYLVI